MLETHRCAPPLSLAAEGGGTWNVGVVLEHEYPARGEA